MFSIILLIIALNIIVVTIAHSAEPIATDDIPVTISDNVNEALFGDFVPYQRRVSEFIAPILSAFTSSVAFQGVLSVEAIVLFFFFFIRFPSIRSFSQRIEVHEGFVAFPKFRQRVLTHVFEYCSTLRKGFV
jgi:hypothetical protein